MSRRRFITLGGMAALLLAGCGRPTVPATVPATDGAKEADKHMAVTKSITLNSGYEMPTQGLGTYALDHATCIGFIHALTEDEMSRIAALDRVEKHDWR